MINNILQNIQIAFEAYRSAVSARDLADAQAKDLKRVEPEKPTRITAESDLVAYLDAVELHRVQVIAFEDVARQAKSECEQAYISLIKAIPLSNIWFRAEYSGEVYGVATIWDVWGGGHRALIFSPWSDDLIPPKDRIYYP